MISFSQDDSEIRKWYLLLCKPSQGRTAYQNLQRMGFDIFMPRHEVQSVSRNAVKLKLLPLFGGYMFISANVHSAGWHNVKNTPGVAKLIGLNSQEPTVVPNDVVNALISRCDHDGVLQTNTDQFAVGDKVKISRGPFANYVATVERIDADQRLYMLLDFLGRSTKFSLDPSLSVRSA